MTLLRVLTSRIGRRFPILVFILPNKFWKIITHSRRHSVKGAMFREELFEKTGNNVAEICKKQLSQRFQAIGAHLRSVENQASAAALTRPGYPFSKNNPKFHCLWERKFPDFPEVLRNASVCNGKAVSGKDSGQCISMILQRSEGSSFWDTRIAPECQAVKNARINGSSFSRMRLLPVAMKFRIFSGKDPSSN